MKTEYQHIVLRTLDNQTRVLFWNVDEFLMMTVPILFGIIIGSFLIMCSGFGIKYIYAKIKKKFPHRSFIHRIYWYLPTQALKRRGALKNLPESHIREFLL